MLHKHCGLNKWEIFKYTLPQIINLLNDNIMYFEGIGGADVHRTKGFKPHKSIHKLNTLIEINTVNNYHEINEPKFFLQP